MGHYILNLPDGDREQALALLRAKTWPLDGNERHGSALACGDLVLVHVARPRCGFIGRAELASAFHEWTPPQADAGPGGHCGGVSLADVEVWRRGVPLDDAVRRIDPTATNPYVQANRAGFRSGVVQITAGEYAAVLALEREARQASP